MKFETTLFIESRKVAAAFVFVVCLSFASCAQAERETAAADQINEGSNTDTNVDLRNTRFEVLNLNDGGSLKYAIHLPAEFDASKSYPAIIGPGEGTKEDSPGYYWHGNPSEHGWIIVESMAHLGTNPVETTRQLLDHLASKYNIEGNKFHMVGYSANSAGSFDVGIELADRFHSLTGVAGYPRTNPDVASASRLKDVKFFFIVGDQDRFWMEASKKAHEHLLGMGLSSQLEIIKDGQHVLKKVDGKPFMKLMEGMR